MKMLKTSLALAISTSLLFGCGDETTNNYYPQEPTVPSSTEAKIAVFNLSFDRYTYEDLVAEMKLTKPEQDALVEVGRMTLYRTKTKRLR